MRYIYCAYSKEYGFFGVFDSNASIISLLRKYKHKEWISEKSFHWLLNIVKTGKYWQLRDQYFTKESPYNGELIIERVSFNREFEPDSKQEFIDLWERTHQ